jgi:hypothetical protein
VIDGFTYGLNAGMIGFGSDNSRGAFDDIAVQRIGRPTTFDHIEDFSDGAANVFTGTRSGVWQMAAGRWNASSSGAPAGAGLAVVDLGLARGLEAAATLDLSAYMNTRATGGLVFDVYGPEDFKFAAYDAITRLVTLGHHTARNGWKVNAQASRSIAAGEEFQILLALKGTLATVLLNGQPAVSHSYNSLLVDGGFGLLTAAGQSSFDAVTIKTDDPALTGYQAGSFVYLPSTEGSALSTSLAAGPVGSLVTGAAVSTYEAAGLLDPFDREDESRTTLSAD